MKAKSIRMPEDLLAAIGIVENEERIEETTAIRKLIRIGFETYVAELYSRGRLSLADVSRMLGITQIEAIDLLLDRGIGGNLDAADVLHSLETFAGTGRGGRGGRSESKRTARKKRGSGTRTETNT